MPPNTGICHQVNLEYLGRVVESASAADYIPNMTSLARQDYDLIIGVGFAQGDAVGDRPVGRGAARSVSDGSVPPRLMLRTSAP